LSGGFLLREEVKVGHSHDSKNTPERGKMQGKTDELAKNGENTAAVLDK